MEASRVLDRFVAASSHYLVDVEAYGRAVTQTFASALDAFEHYRGVGRSACPELFPFIDPEHYASQHRGDIPAEMTVFEHYVAQGAVAGLSPTPLFDPEYVHAQSDASADAPAWNDVFEFVSNPRFRHVDPHPLFSKRYYAAVHADVAAAGLDPFIHFIFHGWKERRSIHPFFQQHDYAAKIPAGCDRLTFNRHLVNALTASSVWMAQPLFDAVHYRRALPSTEVVANPMDHFLRTGWKRGLTATSAFDPAFFMAQANPPADDCNPYIGYLSDFTHEKAPNPDFDPAYYCRQAAVPPSFPGSLLEHFLRFGLPAGASPHRNIVVATTAPRADSGLRVSRSCRARSGTRYFLCERSDHDQLAADFQAIREIEPAIDRQYLETCQLHPYTGPLAPAGQLVIALARKMARCNCLLVAAVDPAAGTIRSLFAPSLNLVNSARPWLTLLLLSRPTVRYWHMIDGCRPDPEIAMVPGLQDTLPVTAHAVIASLPEQLVVNTDPPGVSFLRAHARRLLAVVPRFCLLLDDHALPAGDRQWLMEFIATSYKELGMLICCGPGAGDLLDGAGLVEGKRDARVVHLLENR